MNKNADALRRMRESQLAALTPIETIDIAGGTISIQDAMGQTYTYLGNPSDLTPDDIVAMQINPPAERPQILRNLQDLKAWRAMHNLSPEGFPLNDQPAPRGRASRKKRIARANAKRK